MDDRPHPLSIVGVIENPATKPRRHKDTKFLLFESLCLGGQRKPILLDTLLHRLSSVVYGLYAILGDEMKFWREITRSILHKMGVCHAEEYRVNSDG